MKVGFFEESEGVKSSTRLYSFITLLFTFVVVLYAVVTVQLDANILAIFYGGLTAGFAPKVVQKFAEK